MPRKKSYRVKLRLHEDFDRIYRTDGVPTRCCELAVSYFVWERNTKHNDYCGWSGYINEGMMKSSLKKYNPDNLNIQQDWTPSDYAFWNDVAKTIKHIGG